MAYSCKDIEMVLGQDVYHFIHPLEYFSADEKSSKIVVSLPIDWMLGGQLPSSSSLTSTRIKVNCDHDNELASQIILW